MKTITPPLSQKERTTRNLALISLLCLPIYGLPVVFFSVDPDSLGFVLTLIGILLHITFAIVAWFTRDRAPAIVTIIMTFAGIPLGILCYLFAVADSMRLY